MLICGNCCFGAGASNIYGKVIGRFFKVLMAFSLISLNANFSMLSSWANVYDYDSSFLHQLEANVYVVVSGHAGILQI